MKTRTLIILWSIAIILGISVFLIKKSQSDQQAATTNRSAGQTLFESFPVDKISAIKISDTQQSVSLQQKDGKWLISERDDFPADFRTINNMIRSLAEIKITQAIKAGPTFAPQFGTDESSSLPEKHGITAIFSDAAGKELAKISLGKNLESAAAAASPYGASSIGRYIRNHADSSGFYAVSELFDFVTTDPKAWLQEDFLKIDRIKTISTTQPGNDKNEWELTRENETSEFNFSQAFPGVKAATAEVTPFKSIFSFTRFEDVVPASEIEKRATPDKVQKVKILTFDNITYDITLQPAKSIAENSPEQAPNESFLMTIGVSGEPNKERTKSEGETEELALAADKAFAEQLKALTEQLAKNKQLEGRTFEIDRFSVDALLKNRTALMDKGPGPQDNPPAPGQGNSAFTPPIQIPNQPAPENEPEE